MPTEVTSGHPSYTEMEALRDNVTESGYASGTSSDDTSPEIALTRPHLRFLNRQLQFLEIQDILRWCITTLPNLYQTTAFGPSGLVILDILSKLNVPRPQIVDIIFLDTLHHFPETLALIDKIRGRYPHVNIHIYKPASVETEEEFATMYGPRLWETDDGLYDFTAKVEPAQRAYRELNVNAVITGRRRSQGGKRGELDILEVDERGLVKINPLANWTFDQVRQYIKANDVPYNELLDRGYKSIGDYHSTQPVAENEDERSGRWRGQGKTECGIHNPLSKYAQFLIDQERKRQEEVLSQAIQSQLTIGLSEYDSPGHGSP